MCEPECPAEAILPDTEAGNDFWRALNADHAPQWPNITRKGVPPADADERNGEPEKYEKYFSSKPGEGEARRKP